jgi:hypothetical protein
MGLAQKEDEGALVSKGRFFDTASGSFPVVPSAGHANSHR